MTMIFILLFVFITGCSATMPTFSDYSDAGILKYGGEVKKGWGSRGTDTGALSVGGALGLAALSTGTTVAAGAGAGSGVILALSGLTTWALAALRIVDPTARSNAFNEGTGLILDAEGEYVKSFTQAGLSVVPTTCITPYGAVLFDQINQAIKSVGNLMAGLLPPRSQDGIPPSGARAGFMQQECGR